MKFSTNRPFRRNRAPFPAPYLKLKPSILEASPAPVLRRVALLSGETEEVLVDTWPPKKVLTHVGTPTSRTNCVHDFKTNALEHILLQ